MTQLDWPFSLARHCCCCIIFISLIYLTSFKTTDAIVVRSIRTADKESTGGKKLKVSPPKYLLKPTIDYTESFVDAGKKPQKFWSNGTSKGLPENPAPIKQQEQPTTDECLKGYADWLSSSKGQERPVLVSRGHGKWVCEYKVHIPVPDKEHLVQINVTASSRLLADMRLSSENSKAEQQLQKNNSTANHHNLNASYSHTANNNHNNNINNHSNNNYNNINNNSIHKSHRISGVVLSSAVIGTKTKRVNGIRGNFKHTNNKQDQQQEHQRKQQKYVNNDNDDDLDNEKSDFSSTWNSRNDGHKSPTTEQKSIISARIKDSDDATSDNNKSKENSKDFDQTHSGFTNNGTNNSYWNTLTSGYNSQSHDLKTFGGINKDTQTSNKSFSSQQQPAPACGNKLIIDEPSPDGEGLDRSSGAYHQVLCLQEGGELTQVYHYQSSLHITLVWDPHTTSHIALGYAMVPLQDVSCAQWCHSNRLCLLEGQVCDGHPDCVDGSDEDSLKCTLDKSPPNQALAVDDPKQKKSHMVKIGVSVSLCVMLVVVISAVLMIQFKCCSNVRQQQDSLLQQQSERTHSLSLEIYQSPTSSSGHNGLQQYDQQLSLLPDDSTQQASDNSPNLQHQHHHQQHVSLQHRQLNLPSAEDTTASTYIRSSSLPEQSMLNPSTKPMARDRDSQRYEQELQQKYPHHVPISRDGEEGFIESQKALRLHKQTLISQQVFRPPPNKTVFDRTSPPPPYSLNPTGTKSLDSILPSKQGSNLKSGFGNNNNSGNYKQSKGHPSSIGMLPSYVSVSSRQSDGIPQWPASPPDYHQVAREFPSTICSTPIVSGAVARPNYVGFNSCVVNCPTVNTMKTQQCATGERRQTLSTPVARQLQTGGRGVENAFIIYPPSSSLSPSSSPSHPKTACNNTLSTEPYNRLCKDTSLTDNSCRGIPSSLPSYTSSVPNASNNNNAGTEGFSSSFDIIHHNSPNVPQGHPNVCLPSDLCQLSSSNVISNPQPSSSSSSLPFTNISYPPSAGGMTLPSRFSANCNNPESIVSNNNLCSGNIVFIFTQNSPAVSPPCPSNIVPLFSTSLLPNTNCPQCSAPCVTNNSTCCQRCGSKFKVSSEHLLPPSSSSSSNPPQSSYVSPPLSQFSSIPQASYILSSPPSSSLSSSSSSVMLPMQSLYINNTQLKTDCYSSSSNVYPKGYQSFNNSQKAFELSGEVIGLTTTTCSSASSPSHQPVIHNTLPTNNAPNINTHTTPSLTNPHSNKTPVASLDSQTTTNQVFEINNKPSISTATTTASCNDCMCSSQSTHHHQHPIYEHLHQKHVHYHSSCFQPSSQDEGVDEINKRSLILSSLMSLSPSQESDFASSPSSPILTNKLVTPTSINLSASSTPSSPYYGDNTGGVERSDYIDQLENNVNVFHSKVADKHNNAPKMSESAERSPDPKGNLTLTHQASDVNH